MACAEVKLVRSYFSFRGRWPMLFTTFALQCALVEKIGVASVILLPTKTVIPLADISSLHGIILCFKARTLTLLNLTLTVNTKLT